MRSSPIRWVCDMLSMRITFRCVPSKPQQWAPQLEICANKYRPLT